MNSCVRVLLESVYRFMAKQDKRKSNKRGSQSQSTTKKTSESAKKKTDSTKKTRESAKKKTDSTKKTSESAKRRQIPVLHVVLLLAPIPARDERIPARNGQIPGRHPALELRGSVEMLANP